MEKGPSFDGPYIILIRNYEFFRPSVLKILVSEACVIRTFYLHPLDLIELRLTDEKNNIKYCYVYIISHLPYMNFRMKLKCN